MPTNKLWIEHTERAAWESVTALRRELTDANKRIERMAPPIEGWRDLLEALEVSQREHALGGKSYADVIRGLVDQLCLNQSRLRAAQAELARLGHARSPSAPLSGEVAETSDARPEHPEPTADDVRAFAALAKGFVRAMQRRYAARGSELETFDVDELLGAIEAQLEQMSALGEEEIAPAAVDLAVLALCLYAEARRAASP